MTVLGAIIEPDRVLAWTDSETYAADGTVSGRFNKLRVAACGPVIGFGGGWHGLLRHADAALAEAADVDDAADRVATALRKHSSAAVLAHPNDPGAFCDQLYVLAGWSPRSRRMLGYKISASSFFTPILTCRIASPVLDGFETLRPHSERCITGYAQRQIEHLRAHCPSATGGDLLIGNLSPGGTFICVQRDFATPIERIAA